MKRKVYSPKAYRAVSVSYIGLAITIFAMFMFNFLTKGDYSLILGIIPIIIASLFVGVYYHKLSINTKET
ncbi:hypothetical protein [Bacillus sp. NPDC094106]|uniref:hypothetical protein n=1 Tax=Bacillus sp. NPDC094106 TaxID=3363949 RepID=UPI003804B0A4